MGWQPCHAAPRAPPCGGERAVIRRPVVGTVPEPGWHRKGQVRMHQRGERPAGEDGRRGGVQSVATALELLDCLAAERELGVVELGRRLGIAKSSAHRILTTLVGKGYVQQVPETRNYRLGLRLHELGALVASRNQLRDHALPLLEALRTQTGKTPPPAVPEGAQMSEVERLRSH